jgi:hypothetical protein
VPGLAKQEVGQRLAVNSFTVYDLVYYKELACHMQPRAITSAHRVGERRVTAAGFSACFTLLVLASAAYSNGFV